MPSKLIELEIARPGFFGVNSSASGDVMPKEYSVTVDNFVFNDEGYIESRRGSQRSWSATLESISSSGVTETVRQIFVTTDENGDEMIIFSTNSDIYRYNASAAPDLITGTITAPTAGNWKFVNLNNEIYGTQLGHAMIKLGTPSTGTFVNATLTGTAAPTEANIIDTISAFGRLWHLTTDETLVYSSLLLPENYDPTGSDAGNFNLNASYLNGRDNLTAIAEFNGNLLVFGDRHVTVWENPWNPNGTGAGYGGGYGGVSTDPPMGILENIGGVGCVARDSLQYTQNDLLFLSEQGVTSLARVVQEKSMPLQKYSDNIKKEVQVLLGDSDMTTVWSAYLEAKGMYMFGSSTHSKTYLIDVGGQLQDGTYRALSWSKTFNTMGVMSAESVSSGDMWNSVLVSDEASYLNIMSGYKDFLDYSGAGGSNYEVCWESAWSSIVAEFENHLKMPKRLGVVVKGGGTQTLSMNIAYDYGSFIDSLAKLSTVVLSVPSLYTEATYTESIYGTALAFDETRSPGFGNGRILKLRLKATISGNPLSMQRVTIKSKIGKQS